jgi:hypothetical protein
MLHRRSPNCPHARRRSLASRPHATHSPKRQHACPPALVHAVAKGRPVPCYPAGGPAHQRPRDRILVPSRPCASLHLLLWRHPPNTAMLFISFLSRAWMGASVQVQLEPHITCSTECAQDIWPYDIVGSISVSDCPDVLKHRIIC